MKYCPRCKVFIDGSRQRCPLCETKLTEKEGFSKIWSEGDFFPKVPDNSGIYNLCIKIFLLITVVAIVSSVADNYFFHHRGWWSFFVAAALACIWASAGIAIRKRKNILKNVLWQMIAISLICMIWDKLTGWRGWSVSFVLPITYMTAMLVLFILNKVMRLRAEDYMIYSMMGSLFGLIPLIFLIFGDLKYRVPSVLCVSASVVFLAVLIIFQGSYMVNELKRRSHW